MRICRLIALSVVLFSFSGFSHALAEQLIVYSDEDDPGLRAAASAFTKLTQVRVRIKVANTRSLYEKLQKDGSGSQADVFVTKDSTYLERGRAAKLFRQLGAGVNFSSSHAGEESSWVGIAATVPVLIVNRANADAMRVKSVFELSAPKWKGRIAAMDMSEASFIATVSAYRERVGDEKVRAWLEGLKANLNGAAFSSQRHAVQSVLAGKKDIAWVDLSQYFSVLVRRGDQPAELVVPDQGNKGLGVVWRVKGAAIMKASSQPRASEFVSFLLSEEAQGMFVDHAAMYPLASMRMHDPNMPSVSEYKIVDVPLSLLAAKQEDTEAFIKGIVQQ